MSSSIQSASETKSGGMQQGRRRMYRFRDAGVRGGSLLLVLVVWEVFGRQINPLFASYPSAIAGRFWELLFSGELIAALFETLQPLLLGYLAAAAVGIPLGMAIGRFHLVEKALSFYITAGYATPLVALIPLFILWFGLGFTVKIAVVFFLTIFPIVINTWAGVEAVPRSLVDVGHSFVATETTILRKVVLPATIPYIMTGLRLGVGRAVIGVVLAEFFTALSGLGGMIIHASTRFDTTGLFVPIVVLLALGVGLTALVRVLERRVAPWQSSLTGSNRS